MRWEYVGDEVVGVVTDCDCPQQVLGKWDNADIISTPHEAHDVVPALFESQLPEGVTMERWREWMKLIAAAPDYHKAATANYGGWIGPELLDAAADHCEDSAIADLLRERAKVDRAAIAKAKPNADAKLID